MKKTIMTGVCALSIGVVAALPARAATTIYTIEDVGTFSGNGYFDGNLSLTFAGTGFVGIYPTNTTDAGTFGQSFAHFFGLENYNGIYSETEMQVNITSLTGLTVTSAILSYKLLNGGGGSEGVTVTSYSATGALAYNQTPPNNLGSTAFTSTGLSLNSVNVTTLLQNAVTAGQPWLGLYLTPNGPGDNHQWTYTSSDYDSSGNADSADVRLTVTTVPEPASWALVALGAVILVGSSRLPRRSS